MKSGWPLDARHRPQSLFHRICLQSNTLVACAHRGCLPVCHAGSATARGSGSRSAFYPWALAQTSSTNSLDGRSEHVVAGAGCSARPAGRDGRPTPRIGRAGRSIRSWDLMGAGSSQLRRDGCWLAPRPCDVSTGPLAGRSLFGRNVHRQAAPQIDSDRSVFRRDRASRPAVARIARRTRAHGSVGARRVRDGDSDGRRIRQPPIELDRATFVRLPGPILDAIERHSNKDTHHYLLIFR